VANLRDRCVGSEHSCVGFGHRRVCLHRRES
jgi:hypothetical protein